MNIKSALKTSFAAVLLSIAAYSANSAPQRDTPLLEFVQDMAWLEDNRLDPQGEDAQRAQLDAMNAFFAAALIRLGDLPQQDSDSVQQMTDAFNVHQRLLNQLGESGLSLGEDASHGVNLANLDGAPKLHVRLDNLAQNYLHIAQLVLSDEMGNSDRRLEISPEARERMLVFIARYPVDKEDASGYLSALWFIREGLRHCKCVGDI